MGKSRTTWLKYPMKLSDIMDNDPWNFKMFQDKRNNDINRIMNVVIFMRARTTHVGYEYTGTQAILRRGKRRINLPPTFQDAMAVLVEEGMLEMDVDPFDKKLAEIKEGN